MPAPAGTCSAPGQSARELALSFRVRPDPTATGDPAASSPGVLLPFSVCGSESPVFSGLPHPTPSVFRVSNPLDVFLPPEPPELVSSRNAHGVFPSGLLPLAEPSHPLECGLLPDTSTERTVVEAKPQPQCIPETAPSRACSLRGFATRPAWLSPVWPSRCPPGLLTSREFSSATAHSLHCGSPHELRHLLPQATPAS